MARPGRCSFHNHITMVDVILGELELWSERRSLDGAESGWQPGIDVVDDILGKDIGTGHKFQSG